ncbi:ABC transporter permease [Mycoplasma todarodis]|uniref:ABC transporter permease n=1 Tax=Mycoplasma todarodis TaxID=1937191 RepID=UPI003B37D1D0
MFNLVRYTLRNEFLRLGTYVVPALGIIIYSILTYAQVFGSFAQKDISFIKSGNEYSFITVFAISVIFIALKVINIFRQPKDTGLDIIYASKPISQRTITFSKFISVWILIMYFSLIFLIVTSFVSMIDSHSTSELIWNYSISIFIGNITIMFAISSIFIILSTILSQKIILLFAAITSVFVPSFSIVLSQTIKPHMPSAHLLPAYIKAGKNLEDVSKSKIEIYPSSKNTIFINRQSLFVPNFKMKYDEYKRNGAYKVLAYFDPWYQFSSLYNVTYESKFANDGKKWIEKSVIYHRTSDEFTITINGETYTPLLSKSFKGEMLEINASSTNGIKNIDPRSSSNSLKYLNEVKKISTKFNDWSFVKQMLFVAATKEHSTDKDVVALNKLITSVTNVIDKLSDKEANLQYERGLLTNDKKELIADFKIDGFTLMSWSLMVNNKEINNLTQLTLPKTHGFIDRFGSSYDLTLIKEGESIPVIIPVEYINKKGTYTLWAILTLLMIGASVFIITRRDSH